MCRVCLRGVCICVVWNVPVCRIPVIIVFFLLTPANNRSNDDPLLGDFVKGKYQFLEHEESLSQHPQYRC